MTPFPHDRHPYMYGTPEQYAVSSYLEERERAYNNLKNEPTEILGKMKAELAPKGILNRVLFLFDEKRSMHYDVVTQILNERESVRPPSPLSIDDKL